MINILIESNELAEYSSKITLNAIANKIILIEILYSEHISMSFESNL